MCSGSAGGRRDLAVAMVGSGTANPPRRSPQTASTPRQPEALHPFRHPQSPTTETRITQERDGVRGDRQVRVQPSRVPTDDERLDVALLAGLILNHFTSSAPKYLPSFSSLGYVSERYPGSGGTSGAILKIVLRLLDRQPRQFQTLRT
ncbi:hypothetical protein ACP70R_007170 [Stipagrostis hirtigluma subsp. patula]